MVASAIVIIKVKYYDLQKFIYSNYNKLNELASHSWSFNYRDQINEGNSVRGRAKMKFDRRFHV